MIFFITRLIQPSWSWGSVHWLVVPEQTLKRLGFKVTVKKDVKYREMDVLVRRYVRQVRRAVENMNWRHRAS